MSVWESSAALVFLSSEMILGSSAMFAKESNYQMCKQNIAMTHYELNNLPSILCSAHTYSKMSAHREASSVKADKEIGGKA